MPESTKAPDAFRTISEVAEELDLPQHVLRFWETRFNQIKPMKRGGGRRYYRPEDVELLRGIRLLLYAEGFTIRGVQRLLKEKGIDFVASVGQTGSSAGANGLPEEPAAAVASACSQVPEAQPDAPERDMQEDELPLAARGHRVDAGVRANLDQRTDAGVMRQPELEAEEPNPAPLAPAAVGRRDPRRRSAGLTLSESECRKLELALTELLEAKRQLDQVR